MTQTAIEQLHHKADIWIGQISGWQAFAKQMGKDLGDLSHYYQKVHDLYANELGLCNLLDNSDIIIHASGVSVSSHKPVLRVVSSLFENVEKQLKTLAASALKFGVLDTKKAMSMLDVRLSGIAPGSFYAGFLIEPPQPSKLLGTDEQNALMRTVKDAVISVSLVPQHLDRSADISASLGEQLTEPSLRDSALIAAYHLSPTGRSGISSIDIINPANTQGKARLDIAHRTMLREAVNHRPMIQSKTKQGSFTGRLRRIDLDAVRFDLRGIGGDGYDSIRCILPTLTAEKGREILGRRVKVTGRYELSPSGKPSLMQVENIENVEQDALPF